MPPALASNSKPSAEHGLSIAATYVENESGTKLARPELFRLLSDARPGDILLVEQVDRLSRLTATDWERLKSELAARRVRVVALDLPTSWVGSVRARANKYRLSWDEPIQGHAACRMASTVTLLRRWRSLHWSAGTCWWGRERERR